MSYDPAGRPLKKKTSPWVYVGVGCLVVVVIGVAAVGTGVFYFARKAKQLGEEMKDPKAREAKVKATLHADTLPPGYHAVFAMSVPFVMDMAMLSDRPPAADGQIKGMGERGFIYLNVMSQGKDQKELRDFFEGKTDDASVLRRNNINVHTKEILKRGVIEQKGRKLLYLAHRGDVSFSGNHQSDGLASQILVECGTDSRMRLGIWFGPDPGGTDLTGTPADEAAIGQFMSHFNPCGS
jgi:hypothetical protein